jgi:CubicO group peptidase (beta-lactamase class C family)
MYGIIAKISEDISGRPWEDMVKTEILEPLGMRSTRFFTTFNPMRNNVAQGYVEDQGVMYPVQYDFLRYMYMYFYIQPNF